MSVHKKVNKKGHTYQVRFTQADGRQGSQTFPTKKMAVDFDQRTKMAKRDGLPGLITPSKKLFREYALEYITNSQIEAAPRTTARRAGIVNKYLLPAFGTHPSSEGYGHFAPVTRADYCPGRFPPVAVPLAMSLPVAVPLAMPSSLVTMLSGVSR